MITGEIKSQVDKVWNTFWTGGISNPIEIIEQVTYLLFLKRLDEAQTRAEKQALRTKVPARNLPFPPGNDALGRPWSDLRWKSFQNDSKDVMFKLFTDRMFVFLREVLPTQSNGEESSYAKHLEGARFTIPTANVLGTVVDIITNMDMSGKDTKGDLYEYMLSKLSTAGTNGQFRTPRHIIDLMVRMQAPQPMEEICDPASGTCGFLVQASEYLRSNNKTLLIDPETRNFYNNQQFHGFDFDNTMLRIGAMNLLQHGVENPEVTYRDSLANLHETEDEKYSLILANPPFAGSLDYDNVAKDLLSIVKTKKTELLFLALFLRLLKPGGRAAVIVPDGVLFGSTKAHKELRKLIVDGHRLDAVVKLPSGVFKPYAGVSTAILFFTKTNAGGTENVWFYDVKSDGFSLDDKRTPLGSDDLTDVYNRWMTRSTTELTRARTDQSFTVPRSEIEANDYDLSLNRYKEIEYDEVDHKSPEEILGALDDLEASILAGMAELRELLK
ncbi:type I restriction enzyme M protein [Arthrobacter silviterrae]|uniref:site-specific DNA-methyltransferase (adenine-specific) n=1 Tax=Arthrobacter silviterrae TaxID=2026658 RepID=A0ABX0DE70_9MICC|nr:class I SAM-dependent DNA methyltransferase [Arthrobacter silviterrae]MDQ0276523.1 type I restriction enzyme M protein [Arthrobacter silviterrae]NGN85189.1 SAM-dependent DNA methyltransferase [Arthrobacter silviterrae]